VHLQHIPACKFEETSLLCPVVRYSTSMDKETMDHAYLYPAMQPGISTSMDMQTYWTNKK
jgi:hypothetical protein